MEFRGFLTPPGSLQPCSKDRQVLRSAASKVEKSFGLSGLASGLEGRCFFFFGGGFPACDLWVDFVSWNFLKKMDRKLPEADLFFVFFLLMACQLMIKIVGVLGLVVWVWVESANGIQTTNPKPPTND